MPPPEVWGPAVWTLFHVLAEKVSEDAYVLIKEGLFGQIKKICGFLPCPECSADASRFLEKINIRELKTKTDFKKCIYLFHNWVNVKKRKPLFNYSELYKYKQLHLVRVINNFMIHYHTRGNMKLLTDSFQRTFIIQGFKKWIQEHISAFVSLPLQLPIKLENEIKEVKEEETINEIKEVKED